MTKIIILIGCDITSAQIAMIKDTYPGKTILVAKNNDEAIGLAKEHGVNIQLPLESPQKPSINKIIEELTITRSYDITKIYNHDSTVRTPYPQPHYSRRKKY